MALCKLISADSHVNEPADLWTERIDRKFRDRAPRIIDNIPSRPPGSYLVLEDIPPVHLSQGLGAGKTAEELPHFFQTSTYRDARRGGWDPAERLKDMQLDGVEAEVIYTTLGFRQFWLKDADLQRACFRVYNAWLADYCSYAPKQLTGIALISLYDIGEAVKELRLCRQRGLKGAMIWASPPEERSYADRMYDPFWTEAQELGMPLSLHAVTGMGRESQALRVMGREVKPVDRYVQSVTLGDEVKRSLTELVFSGVLERYPHLRIVSAENEVSWLSFVIQRWDQTYHHYRHLYPSPLKMKPSEYLSRQIYATFIDDAFGIRNRHQIGVDHVMWSSDYPHTQSTWPHSQEIIARDFADVPEGEKLKIVRENAMELYNLESAA
jgi:predicted TIM-barrel fold metal-dependent hydrolase